MSAMLIPDKRWWEVEFDDVGHRDYRLVHIVKVSEPGSDGPFIASQCPGLPLPGSGYLFGNDRDVWAWCTLKKSVKPHGVDENDGRNQFFAVTQWFTTRPLGTSSRIGAGSNPGSGGGSGGFPSGGGTGGQPGPGRCNTQHIEDPLLESPKISGGSQKYQEEAATAQSVDVYNSSNVLQRTGVFLMNSAFEQLRGPQAEFDAHRSTLHIEQNVPALEWNLCNAMLDCVNDKAMWGFPARFIKCSSFNWELMLYGLCYFYFKRVFDFEVFARVDPTNKTTVTLISGWDRILADEGTKAIRGDWDRNTPSVNYGKYVAEAGIDKTKPNNFVRFKDWNGENARCVLDGSGTPITDKDSAGYVKIKKYYGANFLLLGLPI